MYQRKERNASSCYFPSFLYMYIDSPEDMEQLFTMQEPRTEALVLHEYVHYLQDLTTIFGYANTCTLVDQVKWAVAKSCGDNKVSNPYKPENEPDFCIASNANVRKIVNGHGKFSKISEVISFDLDIEKTIIDGKEVELPKAILQFRDPSGNTQTYSVGQYAISESQAYLIENSIYPGVIGGAEDAPYHVAQKIVEKYLPSYNDPLSMIAMCDVALMTPAPGVTFFNLIEVLKSYESEDRPHLSPEGIIGFGLQNNFLRHNGLNTNWDTALIENNKLASLQLQDYFTGTYWHDSKTLVSEIFSHALTLRLKNPLLMLDLAQGGELRDNTMFRLLNTNLGLPSMMNSQNRLYKVIPPYLQHLDIEPELFVCFHSLYEIMFKDEVYNNYNTYNCPLIEHCHESFEEKQKQPETLTGRERDLTANDNDKCNHYPWLNTEPEELDNCPFGRIWATYGIPPLS